MTSICVLSFHGCRNTKFLESLGCGVRVPDNGSGGGHRQCLGRSWQSIKTSAKVSAMSRDDLNLDITVPKTGKTSDEPEGRLPTTTLYIVNISNTISTGPREMNSGKK